MGSPAPTFKKFIKILFRMCVFRVRRTGERIQGGAGFAWGALVWRALTRIPAPGAVGLPGLKLKPCHAPYSRDYAMQSLAYRCRATLLSDGPAQEVIFSAVPSPYLGSPGAESKCRCRNPLANPGPLRTAHPLHSRHLPPANH